eukprot:gene9806-11455_t
MSQDPDPSHLHIGGTIANYISSSFASQRMKGKVCFVTGGASGIGLGIVERYVVEGGLVGIADIDISRAQRVSEMINNKYNGSTIPLKVDVTSEQDVEAGLNALSSWYGGLDVIVSNAGFQQVESIDNVSMDLWRKMMAVHLDGSFLCAKHGIRHFKKDIKRGGSIIFTGSAHSKCASELKAPYVTAKHGLLGLNRSVAKEGAIYNVRSNLICPGVVRTELVEKQLPDIMKRLNLTKEQVIKNVWLKDTVDGEFSTVEDIAEVALTFASMPSNALTGQSLIVSHGWIME